MSDTDPGIGYDAGEVFAEASDRFVEQMERGKRLRLASGLAELVASKLEKLDDGFSRPSSLEIPLSEILDLTGVVRVEEAVPVIQSGVEQALVSARLEEGVGLAARDTAAYVFGQMPDDSTK